MIAFGPSARSVQTIDERSPGQRQDGQRTRRHEELVRDPAVRPLVRHRATSEVWP